MTKTVFSGIRAQAEAEYRSETLFGRDYIVVPVVALVEGVIQGMASDGPELALAEEFARFPAGWDGRPVVMSHPTQNGKPVSANSPQVLKDYQIGFLFNSRRDGQKLKQEAWIDTELAANLNDDSKEVLQRLKDGKPIEVSTGYFAQIEEATGKFNLKSYQGIQRNVVPDHLAFLPNGTLGACSNKDGCGAPRVNQGEFRVNTSCEGECQCGGQCG